MPEVRNSISQALADGRYVKLTDSINILSDVTISGAAVGDTLYNDGAGQWKNTATLKNDVASNALTYTGQLIRMDDNAGSNNNRTWLQIYNQSSQLRFEVSSISNGNPQIRFNVIGNTRIGFPASDPTYFAFINDYTDMWLGNNADRQIYFNYYNGTGMLFGSSLNYMNYSVYINNNFSFFSSGGASIVLGNAINISTGTGAGTKIGITTTQKIGFWNATPIVQPTVTGSRGGNAALASLLTQLAAMGLIVDSTT